MVVVRLIQRKMRYVAIMPPRVTMNLLVPNR